MAISASQRMKRQTNGGLVGDYRLFEIHGKRLADHLRRSMRREAEKGQAKSSQWQSILEQSLKSIKDKIESQTAHNADATFQTSIFDRTASDNEEEEENCQRSASDHSDIESINSLDDDIFSSVGSASSHSTIASIRFTAIEHLVSAFVEDRELSAVYEEAVKRLTKERFVRNQRRILKKFFLDLRSRTQNQLQEQAIRILRGRSERTSMKTILRRLLKRNSIGFTNS
jgi:hypothetical protein